MPFRCFMNKIKILQFPIANSNGGITHYALNNWKFMDKDCFHCDFATMSKKIDFENEIIIYLVMLKIIRNSLDMNLKKF